MRVGREIEDTSTRTDSGEGRIGSPKVIVYNVNRGLRLKRREGASGGYGGVWVRVI